MFRITTPCNQLDPLRLVGFLVGLNRFYLKAQRAIPIVCCRSSYYFDLFVSRSFCRLSWCSLRHSLNVNEMMCTELWRESSFSVADTLLMILKRPIVFRLYFLKLPVLQIYWIIAQDIKSACVVPEIKVVTVDLFGLLLASPFGNLESLLLI